MHPWDGLPRPSLLLSLERYDRQKNERRKKKALSLTVSCFLSSSFEGRSVCGRPRKAVPRKYLHAHDRGAPGQTGAETAEEQSAAGRDAAGEDGFVQG